MVLFVYNSSRKKNPLECPLYTTNNENENSLEETELLYILYNIRMLSGLMIKKNVHKKNSARRFLKSKNYLPPSINLVFPPPF